ncbi:MAG: aldehyde dehydrogenase family protein [Candidatus Thiodiazotropha sp. (ex. Lucinoma kazani)]
MPRPSLRLRRSMPVRQSAGCYEVDILSTIDHIRFMAGWATKIEGNPREISTPNTFAFTLKEPVGVVAAIVPWELAIEHGFLEDGCGAGGGLHHRTETCRDDADVDPVCNEDLQGSRIA